MQSAAAGRRHRRMRRPVRGSAVPAALERGAILVDIRPAAQRAFEGRLPQAVDDHVEWVLLCSQGYTSSLAAAALQDLGLRRATDVIGGYQALAQAGLAGIAGSSASPGGNATVVAGVHAGRPPNRCDGCEDDCP